MKQLQECDFVTAANLLGCEIAAIKAVDFVESKGSGFNADGTPKILFERHKFHQKTNGIFSKNHPNISNAIPGGYGLESNQHNRLAEASQLNRTAALESASWGRYQIMGENWEDLGYRSLQEFINAMYYNETSHLMAFVRYVKANGLTDELKRHDWAGFAKHYNGPGYTKNKYDIKLKAAYQKFSK